MFEDGQAEISLTDEALFGEDRQDDFQPQEDDAEYGESPEERTSEVAEDAESAAPEDGQAAQEQAGMQQVNNGMAADQLQRSYQELRGVYTRATQELAEMRRQNQELAQQLARMQSAAAVAGNGDPEQAIKQFVADPVGWLDNAAGPLLQQKLDDSLADIRREMQIREDSANLNAALAKMASSFPQAKDADGQKTMVEKMVEISSRYGDGYLWRKNPEGMLMQAALELWGMPKVIDQQAVDAAAATGKAQALAELQKKEQAKGQITQPQTQNNKDQTAELSEEEKIIQGIFSVNSGGLFD